ncbi:MAG: MerR family transcriptional regulator [Bifidobacterium tibiigranuli]|jgi:DNA-binding transcriptional MerR regulator|uniref:MerR family transcriptional regulator n=1 Tax=Bifidobacterium tibiigranuli TaxID=2172043 RepID=UPI0023556143|nr:MerR family transcriptional regulator [Bifidobacterium tibiigranuli]MCH3974629.1 MerR family transcriptional regulator [Bifidobacterium tibiigranuli]MCH4189646.1 MerR family transcriptional regulator [Bifidobacterium tibiigranuli]MCH4203597.1 MerR family transcriptional regulator [Bifidobacterium tibiigranuli]MCH4274196.1 MerR family transcriptional regulator [Bifidobacterium tibiigranuli]MCI1253797.1 MerR family transcriptional regulator [Bifidobacterium tibiigranuli]
MSADSSQGLTVGQTAARLGVSVRTLHHWDATGIASPPLRDSRGYRIYTAADVARLQRVIVYRELGMPLKSIKTLLEGDNADSVAELRRQHEQVSAQIAHLQDMLRGLEHMIHARENGVLLTAQQQAAIFGPEWQTDWMSRARKQWEDTPQWAEYAEHAANRTPAEWTSIAQASAEVDAALAAGMRAGVKPGSDEANQLAERHRAAFSSYFHLTYSMQVLLGRMYESNPEYAEHYNRQEPGLATWLREIIEANARTNGVNLETVIWS